MADYVSVEELVAVLHLKPADEPRAVRVCELVNGTATVTGLVDHIIGAKGVAAHCVAAPYPAAAHEAALAIAVDLWRRPTTPGGYFQVADYVGRLSADPASPVLGLLATLRESWSIS